jgi:hypothetical protein
LLVLAAVVVVQVQVGNLVQQEGLVVQVQPLLLRAHL